LTTKIHATCDALGNPVRVLLTPGQQGDITQAAALVDGYAADAVLGDKSYDADALVAQIAEAGAIAVIPSKTNRIALREHDRNLYADRNKIERFFGRLKQYRRVATRYEKLGRNYLSMVFLASALISLR
jgi:transposase